MGRSTFWVPIALLPVAGFLILAFGDDLIDKAIGQSATPYNPVLAWIIGYWWFVVMILMCAHMAFFFVHALVNKRLDWTRRLLWALANLVVWPFSTPLYAWFCTENVLTTGTRAR
jgi:hypothetical protein